MDKGSIKVFQGDIFLTRGSSALSRAIRFCTRSIGEKRSMVNHTGFISTRSPLFLAYGIEALSTVVEHSVWDEYASPDEEIAVYRVKKWNDIDRYECVKLARKYKGYTYGYPALACHFLDWVLQGAYVFRRLTNSEKYPICSWLVDHVCSKLQVGFGVPAGSADPDDIWDYIQAHKEEFEEILPLGRLV